VSKFHVRQKDLNDDGAELAGRRTKTVTRRPVLGWEELCRNDKGKGIRSKVEADLAEDIQSDGHPIVADTVGSTCDDEEEAQDNEHAPLQSFAVERVDGDNESYTADHSTD